MQRPLMTVMEGEGKTTEELEEGFLIEVLQLAERWISQLPSSSRFYGTCVLWQGLARRGLGRREQARPLARPVG